MRWKASFFHHLMVFPVHWHVGNHLVAVVDACHIADVVNHSLCFLFVLRSGAYLHHHRPVGCCQEVKITLVFPAQNKYIFLSPVIHLSFLHALGDQILGHADMIGVDCPHHFCFEASQAEC